MERERIMRFTVITPTWNQASFIEDTIRSVVEQDHEDLEYIIVDNCSDDGTEEIIRSYARKDPRIIYVREKDKGQADAINKGLRRAGGEVVCWLNSDDTYLDSRVLTKVEQAFLQHPETGVVVGDAWYTDKQGKKTEYNSSDRGASLRRWYYVVQPAIFWKNRGKLLDDSYHYAFDWKFFIRETEEQKVFYTHEPYAAYRMYEDNKTGQDNAARKKEIWRLQQELGDSPLNAAWCHHVWKMYEKAEKTGRPELKKRADDLSRLLFHLTGKRIACF